MVLKHCLHQKDNLLIEIIKVCYGTGGTIPSLWFPTWFLTHLFLVYCFGYLILKYSNFMNYSFFSKSFILLLFFLAGALNIQYSGQVKGLPFSADLLLITLTYFMVGYLLKKQVVDFKPNIYLISAFIIIFSCIAFFTNTSINLNMRRLINPFFSLIGSFAGVYLILSLSFFLQKTNRVKKLFMIFGSSSLYILIFHIFITKILLISYERFYELDMLIYYIILMPSIFLPLFFRLIIEKNTFLSLFFLPFRDNKLFIKYKN